MRWNPLRREPQPKAMIETTPFPLDWFTGPFGTQYPVFGTSLVGTQEVISPDFLGHVQQAFKGNPIVFACVETRMLFFQEARFVYREINDARPGDYFDSDNLEPLRRPWPNGHTPDLLALAEVWTSCAGNFFAARRGNFIKPLRPDWVGIILGSMQDPDIDEFDVDAEVIGYVYQPGGPYNVGGEPEFFTPEEIAHYMPIPDPEFPFRGMSWMTPIIQDLLADKEQTAHKRKFLESGATPNLAIKLNVEKVEEFEAWVQKFRETREGSFGNPYQTLFLASAADPIVLGSNFTELDFTNTQGAGEVRIAAAARVHPTLLGIAEGLRGSSLSQGNVKEIARQFADTVMRPLWHNFANSMASIIDVPDGAELWYDDRDIPALQEDEASAANILQVQATTLSSLITAGFTADSAVEAVKSNDLTRLEHSGLVSVQLLPPGQDRTPQQDASSNGRVSDPVLE